jgi:hypothetical protein
MGGKEYPTEACFQIDVWDNLKGRSSSYSVVNGIAEAIEAELNNFTGTVTVGLESLEIQWIYIDDRKDMVEEDEDNKDVLVRRILEFIVWHN